MPSHSNGSCKTWLPYRDNVFIIGQVLSIVALCLSWATWWSFFFFGFPAFVLLQTAWCCKLGRGGLITAAVFAFIASLGDLGIGIALLVAGEGEACDDFACARSTITLGAIAVAGGLLWVAAGVCTLVFVCKRFNKLQNKQDDDDVEPTEATAKALPMGSSDKTPAPPVATAISSGNSATTTIVNLPDGSIKKTVETINPDGSKTITTTVEESPDA